jgi:hypothetical protein
MELIKGLQNIHEGVSECLDSDNQEGWYLILRGLDSLIQQGRFVEFERLIRDAPCRDDPIFQYGVYSRIESIAANDQLGSHARQNAVSFLRDLYNEIAEDDDNSKLLKKWIICIFDTLSKSPNTSISSTANEYLIQLNSSTEVARDITLDYIGSNYSKYPSESALLDRIQKRTFIEPKLHKLKRISLQDQPDDVYIPPLAKSTINSTESFDLKKEVNEFLKSDKKVLLILGNSGAGKSTFNRRLEADLWRNYKAGDRVPLFIYLPSIDKPYDDLIGKHLCNFDMTDDEIRELKVNRELILICDAYDETQLRCNLYQMNRFNTTGGWRVQMVISCRIEYNGREYVDQFQPGTRNKGVSNLYQECVIAPFNNHQIDEYIQLYIDICQPPWGLDQYNHAFRQIQNLLDLVTNPFLLRLAMETLPDLVGSETDLGSTSLTRVMLYDQFVIRWIRRAIIRRNEMQLDAQDQRELSILSRQDIVEQSIEYLKELSIAIYKHHNGNPSINRAKAEWKKGFFEEGDLRQELLREATLIIRTGKEYKFLHKSVLEYVLSLAIYDPASQDIYDLS